MQIRKLYFFHCVLVFKSWGHVIRECSVWLLYFLLFSGLKTYLFSVLELLNDVQCFFRQEQVDPLLFHFILFFSIFYFICDSSSRGNIWENYVEKLREKIILWGSQNRLVPPHLQLATKCTRPLNMINYSIRALLLNVWFDEFAQFTFGRSVQLNK